MLNIEIPYEPHGKKIRFIYIEWFLIFELFSIAVKFYRNDGISITILLLVLYLANPGMLTCIAHR